MEKWVQIRITPDIIAAVRTGECEYIGEDSTEDRDEAWEVFRKQVFAPIFDGIKKSLESIK